MTTHDATTDRPVTTRRVRAQLAVCVGCCCGRVDRGHPEVPVDALAAAWKEHELGGHVQLTVSRGLGPCDRAARGERHSARVGPAHAANVVPGSRRIGHCACDPRPRSRRDRGRPARKHVRRTLLTKLALLLHGDRRRRLGRLESLEHYAALVRWARDVAERGDEAPWPTSLDAHAFDRWAGGEV